MIHRIATILKDRIAAFPYVDELGADSKERMTGIAERFLEA